MLTLTSSELAMGSRPVTKTVVGPDSPLIVKGLALPAFDRPRIENGTFLSSSIAGAGVCRWISILVGWVFCVFKRPLSKTLLTCWESCCGGCLLWFPPRRCWREWVLGVVVGIAFVMIILEGSVLLFWGCLLIEFLAVNRGPDGVEVAFEVEAFVD